MGRKPKEEKRCFTCGGVEPEKKFYARHKSMCSTCSTAYTVAWQKAKRDRLRAGPFSEWQKFLDKRNNKNRVKYATNERYRRQRTESTKRYRDKQCNLTTS